MSEVQNLIPEEGIVKDLPFELYAAEPAINSGMITMYCRGRTPAHIKAKYIDKKVKFDSEDLEFGRNAHCILLEPEKFRAKHIVMPKFTGKTLDGRDSEKSKEAKEKKERWLESLPGDAIVVSEEDVEDFTGMLNQLMGSPLVKTVLSEGCSEVSGFWLDKETGARCKMRVDYINMIKKAVIDYKTCRDASLEMMTKQIENLYYHVQIFHYATGLRVLGRPIEDLIIISQEKTYPYLPNTLFMTDLMIEDAQARWRNALNVLAECMKTNIWPGFPQVMNEVNPTNRLIYKQVI